MNDWEMLRRTAERLRKNYPSGTRVRLIQMGSDPRPVIKFRLLDIGQLITLPPPAAHPLITSVALIFAHWGV